MGDVSIAMTNKRTQSITDGKARILAAARMIASTRNGMPTEPPCLR